MNDAPPHRKGKFLKKVCGCQVGLSIRRGYCQCSKPLSQCGTLSKSARWECWLTLQNCSGEKGDLSQNSPPCFGNGKTHIRWFVKHFYTNLSSYCAWGAKELFWWSAQWSKVIWLEPHAKIDGGRHLLCSATIVPSRRRRQPFHVPRSSLFIFLHAVNSFIPRAYNPLYSPRYLLLPT